ncbi:MAG TPA: hypothetical protein VJI98_04815 [Candidatus Nanoarchaeia archaeon]|nr:hypothetical protein [Candidatus Nanoarchaeia archaeon]
MPEEIIDLNEELPTIGQVAASLIHYQGLVLDRNLDERETIAAATERIRDQGCIRLKDIALKTGRLTIFEKLRQVNGGFIRGVFYIKAGLDGDFVSDLDISSLIFSYAEGKDFDKKYRGIDVLDQLLLGSPLIRITSALYANPLRGSYVFVAGKKRIVSSDNLSSIVRGSINEIRNLQISYYSRIER